MVNSLFITAQLFSDLRNMAKPMLNNMKQYEITEGRHAQLKCTTQGVYLSYMMFAVRTTRCTTRTAPKLHWPSFVDINVNPLLEPLK